MLPNSKLIVPCAGLTSAGAGTDINCSVDMLGFDFLSLDIWLSTFAAASTTLTTIKLGDGSVTNLTSATDIVAFTGGTSVTATTGWVIPTAMSTSVPTLLKFNVDCRSLDRYLTLEVVPVTAHTAWVFCNKFRGGTEPTTAAQVGVAAVVNNFS